MSDALRQRPASLLTALAAVLLLSGCSSLDYYRHLANGQLQLLNAREPIAELLKKPTADPILKQRLAMAQQARDFASAKLALPDNNSYRVYADIQRPFVLWNVLATDELSLAPELHCFPIAGCVAYRGFFSQGRARGAAALLKEQGLDTYIGGVEAYSTLGWFDDPIISTMLRWSDERLVAVIFHELAHQQLYIADDSAFNESFASFVEREGLAQWRTAQRLPPADAQGERQRAHFTALVMASRERLQRLYDSDLARAPMRAGKQAEFERLRAEYHALSKREWAGNGRYDNWINAPMNNAKLLPFGLYDQWVPAFAALFEHVGRDWPSFYQRAATLGRLTQAERREALIKLSAGT